MSTAGLRATTRPRSRSTEALPFARFAADGREVTFYEVEGQIEIGVLTPYPQQPLLPAQFASTHSPAEAFLALSNDDRMALPEPLARTLTAEERAAVTSAEAVARVRADLDSLRTLQFRRASDVDRAPPAMPQELASCSQSFKTWVNGVYGGNECGLQGVATHTDTSSTTYCESGCAGSIYFYGGGGDCSQSLSQCSNQVFTGTAQRVNFRSLNKQGNLWFAHNGFFSHFGAANCTGNGPLLFKRRYGSGDFTTKSVPVNHMYHYFAGKPMTEQGPAHYGVFYGGYKKSTAELYHRMEIEQNASTNDRAIVCGDIYHSFNATPPPAYTCGGCAWCTTSSPCNGCFRDCVGG
jgi:hypothetical protein